MLKEKNISFVYDINVRMNKSLKKLKIYLKK